MSHFEHLTALLLVVQDFFFYHYTFAILFFEHLFKSILS